MGHTYEKFIPNLLRTKKKNKINRYGLNLTNKNILGLKAKIFVFST